MKCPALVRTRCWLCAPRACWSMLLAYMRVKKEILGVTRGMQAHGPRYTGSAGNQGRDRVGLTVHRQTAGLRWGKLGWDKPRAAEAGEESLQDQGRAPMPI